MDLYNEALRVALVDPVTGKPRFRITLENEALLTPEVEAWLREVEKAIAANIVADSKGRTNVVTFPTRDP